MTDIRYLPYDIHIAICSALSPEDAVHLAFTCTSLKYLLGDVPSSKRVVDTWASFSKDAIQVQSEAKLAPVVLKRLYQRKKNVANASPASIAKLGTGSAFYYHGGVLVYIDSGKLLRVLDVHGSSTFERVLDIYLLVDRVLAHSVRLQQHSITPMGYNDSVLTILCELSNGSKSGWLVFIDTSGSPARTLGFEAIADTNRLFVRQCRDYVLFGTHTGPRSDSYREWVIKIVKLSKEPCQEGELDDCTKQFQLKDFVGSDVGSNVAFEIHGDWVYGVANQTMFEVEEVDWTSCYHIFRCKVDDPLKTFDDRTIYRRQHDDGPLNDSWTRLELQVDETTNQLVIIESRKEWTNGGSRQQRGFYTSFFDFSPNSPERIPPTLELDSARTGPGVQSLHLPENDIMVTQATANSCYLEPLLPIARKTHLEPPSTSACPAFSLTKTKFSCYNLSAMAFLDLVNDPLRPTAANNYRELQRLRLRIGSRTLTSPLVLENGVYKHREVLADREGNPIPDSADCFIDGKVRLWPSEDAAQEVWDILNPPASGSAATQEIQVAADERTLIYMMGNRDSMEKTIVCVNFDPCISLHGRKGIGEAADTFGRASGCISADVGSACFGPRRSAWDWTERAMYLQIGKAVSFDNPHRWW